MFTLQPPLPCFTFSYRFAALVEKPKLFTLSPRIEIVESVDFSANVHLFVPSLHANLFSTLLYNTLFSVAYHAPHV